MIHSEPKQVICHSLLVVSLVHLSFLPLLLMLVLESWSSIGGVYNLEVYTNGLSFLSAASTMLGRWEEGYAPQDMSFSVLFSVLEGKLLSALRSTFVNLPHTHKATSRLSLHSYSYEQRVVSICVLLLFLHQRRMRLIEIN